MRNGRASARANKAGVLLIAAGAFTIINNYLPGAGHLDVAVLNAIGGDSSPSPSRSPTSPDERGRTWPSFTSTWTT